MNSHFVSVAIGAAAGALIAACYLCRRQSCASVAARTVTRPIINKRACRVFVITGGPCSGKTSGMAILRRHFTQAGYKVLVVPEVATLLFNAGVELSWCNTPEKRIARQNAILATMMHLEHVAAALSQMADPSPAIVLCDRGAMDGSAYCSEQQWADVLGGLGVTNETLLDRYDAVVHLVTTADGAPDAYNNTTNGARYEGIEAAKVTDSKTQNAWRQHQHRFVVDNSTGFDEKMYRTFEYLHGLCTA